MLVTETKATAELTFAQQLRLWQRFQLEHRGPHACWLWTGDLDRSGYGMVRFRRDSGERWLQTHRLAYELMVGPIPEGLQLDHLCRVRHCGNPQHLEPVTPGENVRRSPFTGTLDRCKNGHIMDSDNVYVRRNGWRECRTCRRNGRPPTRPRSGGTGGGTNEGEA